MVVNSTTLTQLHEQIIGYRDAAELMAGFPMLQLRGKSFSINDHFFFKPMFRVTTPRQLICKTARQVGKTQALAAGKTLKSTAMPYFNILFMSPRFEQIKRFSTNYVKPLIMSSPMRKKLIDTSISQNQNVLQRTFRLGGIHFYSFALLDAERVRGISANEVCIDEVQDMLWDNIPVINQTLSGSRHWKQKTYTGTPKTLDNTIQKLWADSSMGEWATRCEACNHWNIACLEHDLLKMIGKTTVVCAKCGRPINPRDGGWIFQMPEKTPTFLGYHIPQIIHPFHYEEPENWAELLLNQRKYPTSKFMNECLGESYDSAEKLITLSDLRAISALQSNTLQQALLNRRIYNFVAIGIDWGGGGSESESYTSMTVAGVRPGDDTVHILCSFRLSRNLLPAQEVSEILQICTKFRPDLVAHDYTGAGYLREVMMIQCGMPAEKLIPFTYSVTANKAVIYPNMTGAGPGKIAQRASYTMDKPRSLMTLCAMMKAKKILLPSWPVDDREDNVFLDFLNLIQLVQERPRGSDVYLIDKTPDTPDDTCHSLNYACSAIWYCHQRYPDMAEALNIRLSQEDISSITPRDPQW